MSNEINKLKQDLADMKTKYKELEETLKKNKKTKAEEEDPFEPRKGTDDVTRVMHLKNMTQELKNTREEILDITKSQALEEGQLYQTRFVSGEKFKNVLNESLLRSKELFGSTQLGKEAYTGLQNSMNSFISLSESQMQTMVNNTAMFAKFGVRVEQSAMLYDTLNASLGKTPEFAEKLSREMVTLAQDLAMPPSELVENFNRASTKMAYPVNDMIENFRKLQKVSRTTGVSFDTLTSAFGDTMDNFGGSAEVAGKLNAVLGDSLFNSIELLGMTEAERVTTIADKVRSSLASKGITDVAEMGKFQLKAVASAMGVPDVDTARRILSGEQTMEEALKETTGFKSPEERTAKTLGDFNDSVMRTRTELENWSLALYRLRLNVERRKGMIDIARELRIDGERSKRLLTRIESEFGRNADRITFQVLQQMKAVQGFADSARAIAEGAATSEDFRKQLNALIEASLRGQSARIEEALEGKTAADVADIQKDPRTVGKTGVALPSVIQAQIPGGGTKPTILDRETPEEFRTGIGDMSGLPPDAALNLNSANYFLGMTNAFRQAIQAEKKAGRGGPKGVLDEISQ